ncbi:unnamed protein product [Nesidiocoris tenuis]|uniref:Uncharacterized protein n=1 Tax=Nesidiocoris tenuis TaxID=355587 RepID=A0A6H5H3G3_9HEMI|nr:unnamed protein product [Nesidiocoris tenuis]
MEVVCSTKVYVRLCKPVSAVKPSTLNTTATTTTWYSANNLLDFGVFIIDAKEKSLSTGADDGSTVFDLKKTFLIARTVSQHYSKTMTTPMGERLLKFHRHAARHSRVYGPRPNCQRRAGLRAALITFGKVFQLGLPAHDAPEDGRTAEGTRAIINFEIHDRQHEECQMVYGAKGTSKHGRQVPAIQTFGYPGAYRDEDELEQVNPWSWESDELSPAAELTLCARLLWSIKHRRRRCTEGRPTPADNNYSSTFSTESDQSSRTPSCHEHRSSSARHDQKSPLD